MVCSALSTGWHDVDIDVDTDFVCLKEIVSKSRSKLWGAPFFRKAKSRTEMERIRSKKIVSLGRTAYGRGKMSSTRSCFLVCLVHTRSCSFLPSIVRLCNKFSSVPVAFFTFQRQSSWVMQKLPKTLERRPSMMIPSSLVRSNSTGPSIMQLINKGWKHGIQSYIPSGPFVVIFSLPSFSFQLVRFIIPMIFNFS